MATHPASAPNKPSSIPKPHHRQIQNNVPNPTSPLSNLNKLSTRIRNTASRAWKSFQARSLANDQRYNLYTILTTKRMRTSISQTSTLPSPKPRQHPPEQSAPYPDTDPISSPVIHQHSAYEPLLWNRTELLPPIPCVALPLSYAARIIPYRPGHRPAVQSPYYLLVCLPESHTDSAQQQEQLGHAIRGPIRHRLSPLNHHAILCSPYRPYCATVPTHLSPGDTAS